MENNTQSQTAVKKFEEKTFEAINNKIASFIENGDIKIPSNYSAENAVRSAWLHLQDLKDRSDKPVLEVCTAASISNAILRMVVQGLSVVKGQCAFIAYGNMLTYQRQYQGSIALAKRVSNVKDVKANAIYEKDEFAFEVNTDTGVKKVIKHVQSLESIDPEKVKGAYAIIELHDGTFEHTIMTIAQIRKSWEMGGTKGYSPAHKNFADEMACKTAINRACKLKISASDDSDLYEDDEQRSGDQVADGVKTEIKNKANKRDMTFDDAEVVNESQKQPEEPENDKSGKTNQQQENSGPGY